MFRSFSLSTHACLYSINNSTNISMCAGSRIAIIRDIVLEQIIHSHLFAI